MNFLNIGPMELLFILILALIVFGPSRLPEIGRALGKSLREFRQMTQEFSKTLSEFEEELGGEIKGTSETLTSTVSEVKRELEEASKALTSPVTQVGKELEEASQELRKAASGGPDEDTSPQKGAIQGEPPPAEEMAGEESQEKSIATASEANRDNDPFQPEAEELVTRTEE